MPYPGEHAARIKSPKRYIRFRRENNKFGQGIDVIWGVLPNGKAEVQAIRFKSSRFTGAQAKSWLKEHDYKTIEFEAAAKKDSAGDQGLAGVCRFDVGEIRGTAGLTEEGYLKADAAVTRTGVFYYQQPDGTTRRELRHPNDVFTASSLDSMRMKPVTNNHPPVRIIEADSAKQFQVGFTGENIRPDAPFVMAPLVITDKDSIKDVENGRRELSCGYICDLVEEDGVYLGEAYDHRQTNIRYNHIAVVDAGRAGANVRIQLDSADAVQIDSDGDKSSCSHSRKERQMPVITLDGINYEADQEVINHLHRVEGERDEGKSKLDSMAAERDTLKGERDALKEKADAADKRDVKKEIADGVKARLDLERKASTVLDKEQVEKIDSMSEEDIKKAVILASSPDAKLDGQSEAYIDARFDAAIEMGAKGEGNMADQRQQSTPRKDTKPDDNSQEEARKRLINDSKDAWKGEKK